MAETKSDQEIEALLSGITSTWSAAQTPNDGRWAVLGPKFEMPWPSGAPVTSKEVAAFIAAAPSLVQQLKAERDTQATYAKVNFEEWKKSEVEINTLRAELAAAQREVKAVLDSLGNKAVRVSENGGPEDIYASLAVSVAKLAKGEK